MNGIVYLATNKTNGKQYVGLTKRSLEARWNQHVNVANKGAKTYFHHAIVKYGMAGFDVHPIVSALSLDYLADLERTLIADLKPEYNQTNGGEVTMGRKYNDAAKEQIRLKNTGQKRTLETRKKLSDMVKQRYIDRPELKAVATKHILAARSSVDEEKRKKAAAEAAKNQPWTAESRAKLSASCMGRRYGADIIAKITEKTRKKVLCGTTGVIYSCREEAAKATGISPQSIWRVCNGKYPSVKGLKFSYLGVHQ
jgi:group I intron endonuclease